MGSPDPVLHGEEGRRFSLDVFSLLEDAVLSPEPAQLLAFVSGRALPLASVDLGLLDPLPQGLGRHSEFPSGLRDRPPGKVDEPDGLSAELRRVWWSGSRHLFSSPWTVFAKSLPVHRCEAIPEVLRADVGSKYRRGLVPRAAFLRLALGCTIVT